MRRSLDVRRLLVPLLALAVGFVAGPVAATPALTIDVATGDVLYQEDATQPWYPASTTKLMTVYVALSAVRDHQIAMNTPLVVSARAHKMPPSKMGFAIGTQVTLENALKMLMVRSANDVAITVAEGISGSVEAFADDMNQAAAGLGMRDSHFVNPNGLPSPDHYSSARDMAILARALYAQFPDDTGLYNLGELALGAQRIGNHNNLLGRYPGADGMKTGFTCPAGFNVVASAYRDGRRIVVVVFGAPSVATRSQKVVALFDRAFAGIDRPLASVLALPISGGSPPDMRDQICRTRAPLIAQFNAEVEQLDQPLIASAANSPMGLSALAPERALLFSSPTPSSSEPWATRITSMPQPIFDPVPVRIGADPGYAGVVAEARPAHSPIGTATPPVTVQAYAASLSAAAGDAPLPVDPTALPLRGRHVRPGRIPRRTRTTMSAAAEAPTTQIIAGEAAKPATPSRPPVKIARMARAKPAAKAAAKPPVKSAVAKAATLKASAKAAPKGGAKVVSAKAEPKKAAGAKPAPKKVAARGKSKGNATN